MIYDSLFNFRMHETEFLSQKSMLWIKAFHIISFVAWFSGLFYLPRLFVYHAMAKDKISNERFKIMERKLFWAIMTPAAISTILFGFWMFYDYAWAAFGNSLWLNLKLVLVLLLTVYHLFCGYYVRVFAKDINQHSDRFYRFFNEVPTLLLVAIVVLTVVKPI